MITELLKPTCDSKTRFYKTQKNTYGLLPGGGMHLLNGVTCKGSCPGATTGPGGCWNAPDGRKNKTCYVDNLMKVYKNVGGVLAHNTELMMEADYRGKVELLLAEFERFRKTEARRKKKGNTPYLYYRLHWSGDIFDQEYARALKQAMTTNSDIEFWCYTRSFFSVPILCDTPNLNLYLSLDPVNYVEGMATYVEHRHRSPRLAVCYMAKEKDVEQYDEAVKAELERRNLTGDKPLDWALNPRYTPCPADTKRLKTEEACKTCGKCIFPGPGNVWFKT
jgi:hypothetical protein